MKRFQYLRPKEVEQLNDIPINRRDAWIILYRNKAALTQLRTFPLRRCAKGDEHALQIMLGCPHCNEGFDCTFCVWARGEVSYERAFPCCYQPFAGVTHADVCDNDRLVRVEYGNDKVILGIEKPFACKLAIFNAEYLECVGFLMGHVEWARAILNHWI